MDKEIKEIVNSLGKLLWGIVKRWFVFAPYVVLDLFNYIAELFGRQNITVPIIWGWVLLVVTVFVAILLTYHDLNKDRLAKVRENEVLQKQIDNQIIAPIEEKKRIERIEIRKPYLLLLPNTLLGIETEMTNLAEAISKEHISDNKSFGELSYYTSRIKERGEHEPNLEPFNLELRNIKHNIADPKLTKLLNEFIPALNGFMAHKCFSMYIQNSKRPKLEAIHKSNEVEELMRKALDTLLTQINKRREELLMGVEVNNE